MFTISEAIVLLVATAIGASTATYFWLNARRETLDHAPDADEFVRRLMKIEKRVRDEKIDKAEGEMARAEVFQEFRRSGRPAPHSSSEHPVTQFQPRPMAIAGAGFAALALIFVIANQYAVPSSAGSTTAALSNASSMNPAPVKASAPATQTNDLYAQLQNYSRKPALLKPTTDDQKLPDVDTMIDRLVARLKERPDDLAGWRNLGWAYFNMKQFKRSQEAYGRAVELDAGSATLQVAYGESMVKAADGKVIGKAQKIFESVLKREPKNEGALYYTGLAAKQNGAKTNALKIWMSLLKDTQPGSGPRQDLKRQVTALASELGVDITAEVRSDAMTTSSTAGLGTKGPTKQDIRDAQQLSGPEQNEMVRGMVDRLAARLKKAPDDPDGWLRLIRSRMVMGDNEAALSTLKEALKVFQNKPAIQKRIAQTAGNFGIALN